MSCRQKMISKVFKELMSERSGSRVKTGFDWVDKAGIPVRKDRDLLGNIWKA